MNVITKIEDWGNSHRPGFLDIFRILLGIYITYKGVVFASNIESLELSVEGLTMLFTGVVLAHYVIFAHLLCGPLIIFGLLTRIMCLVQIPLLLGAVFLVNAPKGFTLETDISLIVLGGLIVFVIFGAGKFSIDEKRRQEKLANSAKGAS
jgi:putative oxidoreductase